VAFPLPTPEAQAAAVLPSACETQAVVVVPMPVMAGAGVAAAAIGDVVLDYCAVVRGILNDDQGGPLRPSGVRMAEALGEVRESLGRSLETKKGGPRRSDSIVWRAISTGGWLPWPTNWRKSGSRPSKWRR
jgi:hypothetical protein